MKLSSNERNVHYYAYQCLIIQDTRNCRKIVLLDIYPRPDISMSAFLVWPIIVSTLLITNAYHPSVFIHETIFAVWLEKHLSLEWKWEQTKKGETILLRRKIFFFYCVPPFFLRKKVFFDSVVADHKFDPTFAIVWQCRRVCKICQFSPLGTIPYTIQG